MRFRMSAGLHVENDPEGKEKVYRPGDVIETKHDLARLLNQYDRNGNAVSVKFERLSNEPPRSATFAALERMDENGLREWAEENEVDVAGAKDREGLLKLIKAAYGV